ncbi:MAG: MaoC/PaaZ C-terminal domain-containing protein [Steroidobacteraceae bacterium]|jgi:acyl dehydratase|nr:MaoC/PaaZ C-terminal domain-containing protein [Steroidobacteraceae bacterium]
MSQQAPARRYFEDLAVGEVRESSAHTMTRDEMIDFASRYDPQYFHADVEAAKGSTFGEVIASGIHTMAIWRRLDHEIAHDIAWICGVAWNDVRWRVAVRAGDTLRARSKCLAKRESGADPRRGVVEYHYSLVNQRGETAWECVSVNLVERRPPAP